MTRPRIFLIVASFVLISCTGRETSKAVPGPAGTAAGLTIYAAQGAGLPRRRPRVMFSTFPQEPHALGLLMAEAMFTLEGCLGISLGVQTPIPEIAAAARAHEADILALSFSSMIPASQATAGLTELRGLIPDSVEIWAGGACAGLRPKPGVTVLRALSAIGPAVTAWRAREDEGSAPM